MSNSCRKTPSVCSYQVSDYVLWQLFVYSRYFSGRLWTAVLNLSDRQIKPKQLVVCTFHRLSWTANQQTAQLVLPQETKTRSKDTKQRA